MISRLKRFLKTPGGRLAAALTAFAASQLLLVLYFFGDMFFSPPTASRMTALRSELVRNAQSLESLQKEIGAYETLRSRCREMAASAWQEKKHGPVETQLRQMVAARGARMEFTFSNIGAVRMGRINADFYYADLEVSGSGSLEEVTKVLLALQQLEPKPAWKHLNLRPERRPNRPGTGSANLAGRTDPAVNATRLNFNGTLRMIGYDGTSFPPLREKRK